MLCYVMLWSFYWCSDTKKKKDEMQNYMLFDRCVLKIIAGMCSNTRVGVI
jgi:hypothetical protein